MGVPELQAHLKDVILWPSAGAAVIANNSDLRTWCGHSLSVADGHKEARDPLRQRWIGLRTCCGSSLMTLHFTKTSVSASDGSRTHTNLPALDMMSDDL